MGGHLPGPRATEHNARCLGSLSPHVVPPQPPAGKALVPLGEAVQAVWSMERLTTKFLATSRARQAWSHRRVGNVAEQL